MVQGGDFEIWGLDDKAMGPRAIKAYPYSFVVPMREEAGNVPKTLTRLGRFLRAARLNAEVITIDDGSEDGTADACVRWKSYFENLSVIRHATRQGRGASARTGVLLSTGQVVIVLDPRGDTAPEDALELLHAIKRGADFAIASRRVPGAGLHGSASFLDRASETAFTMITKFMVPVGVEDCGTELLAMCRRPAREVIQRSTITGDAFAHEWLALAERLGHRVSEVPVTCLGENAADGRRRPNELAMLRDVWKLRRRLGKEELPKAQTAYALLRQTSFTRLDRNSLMGTRSSHVEHV